MDSSKTYIEMCREAKEIQENWKPKPSDLFWDTFAGDIEKGKKFTVGDEDEYDYPFEKEESYIFLPRQDQLQEMLRGYANPFEVMSNGILDIPQEPYDGGFLDVDSKEYQYYRLFDTYEKLWLVFIMKQRFNKFWNLDLKQWT